MVKVVTEMLNFRTLCACFVCLVLIVTTYAQDAPMTPFEKLSKHFYYKCYYSTQNVLPFQKLYNDSSEFMTYLETAAQFIPDRKDYFCNTERKQLATRVDTISKDLVPCLPPEEKYLSNFFDVSVKEIFHFLCHNKGENMDRLFSTEGKNCRAKIERDNSNELENCFGRIFRPLSDKFVTKKEICENMQIAKKCLSVVLQQKCPNTRSMQELNEEFFKYVGETCSGCVSYYLSTVLIIMSVVLPYVFNR